MAIPIDQVFRGRRALRSIILDALRLEDEFDQFIETKTADLDRLVRKSEEIVMLARLVRGSLESERLLDATALVPQSTDRKE